ncbi:hypothetical protein MTO96_049784 [Rhipicephalus appendiculatus]
MVPVPPHYLGQQQADGVTLYASRPHTVVQLWKGAALGHTYPWSEYAASHTERGYEVVLSSCWYLDHYEHSKDWAHYYACDPRKFSGKQYVRPPRAYKRVTPH